jgi:hypothetical protein
MPTKIFSGKRMCNIESLPGVMAVCNPAVSGVPGIFIARGIATDGHLCYPVGTVDENCSFKQTGFLALSDDIMSYKHDARVLGIYDNSFNCQSTYAIGPWVVVDPTTFTKSVMDGGTISPNVVRIDEQWSRNIVVIRQQKAGWHYLFRRHDRSSIEICTCKNLKSVSVITKIRPIEPWEGVKVGAGAAFSHSGYVYLFYYGSTYNREYRVGLYVFIDGKPTKAVRRSVLPVLYPDQPWEMAGCAPMVTFPTSVVKQQDGTVYLFYGAADKYIAVAETDVDTLRRWAICDYM